MRLSLTQRISVVFSALLLACCGASAWLQIRASDLHDQEVIQALSHDLASHIAHSSALMGPDGPRPAALRTLFGQLMAVNPSVEVYLLDASGRITGDDAPPGHIRRTRVDLQPVQRFLANDALPILGDDPRSVDAKKVFSAAVVPGADGRLAGYIYVVLIGEARDALATRLAHSTVLRTTLGLMAVVASLGLFAGLIAFGLITRPLRRLTDSVSRIDASIQAGSEPVPLVLSRPAAHTGTRDEIAILERTFAQMVERIGMQWRELKRQDQERRELFATISHDLRTPLTSLHGYLETLSLKDDTLEGVERRRYLAIALTQSAKVGRLAQSLFELARLEHENVQLTLETFPLADVVQDVFQKFELAAQARRIRLRAVVPPRLPAVCADLAMTERVLTNLLDNAIRHTPEGGEVSVELAGEDSKVRVVVSDTGPGIAPELRANLFRRAFSSGDARRQGGLGLLIVQRMLQLHGSVIELIERDQRGATFSFRLDAAPLRTAPRT
ncbi:ATP-binding protein [Paraburkholderia tropica]|uniref:sensor histidine kinase n=1 Tax=Paraburkholderia tropica TaxID=92647 RepID=UPI0007EDDCAD|nr:ATP-binding protein [Paraburkholderia tropica]MBB2981105.1 signal transduction histidine kinase [Paraburkholderia tropica]OBR52985.1 two-component sensor histidine kinase [Paraburkholderia tropica]